MPSNWSESKFFFHLQSIRLLCFCKNCVYLFSSTVDSFLICSSPWKNGNRKRVGEIIAFLLSTVGMTEIEFNHTKNDHSRFLQFDFNKSMTLMSLWLLWVYDSHESLTSMSLWMTPMSLWWVYDSYESMTPMSLWFLWSLSTMSLHDSYESLWIIYKSMTRMCLWGKEMWSEERKMGGDGQKLFLNKFIT